MIFLTHSTALKWIGTKYVHSIHCFPFAAASWFVSCAQTHRVRGRATHRRGDALRAKHWQHTICVREYTYILQSTVQPHAISPIRLPFLFFFISGRVRFTFHLSRAHIPCMCIHHTLTHLWKQLNAIELFHQIEQNFQLMQFRKVLFTSRWVCVCNFSRFASPAAATRIPFPCALCVAARHPRAPPRQLYAWWQKSVLLVANQRLRPLTCMCRGVAWNGNHVMVCIQSFAKVLI